MFIKESFCFCCFISIPKVLSNKTSNTNCNWMDLEIIILSEVSQTEKDKYRMISLYVESKKRVQMNLSTKQKQSYRCRRVTDVENKLMVH